MEQDITIKVADKEKCPCARCVYGLFGGWANWKCGQFKDGKPSSVLYDNQKCEKFVERNDRGFETFKKSE